MFRAQFTDTCQFLKSQGCKEPLNPEQPIEFLVLIIKGTKQLAGASCSALLYVMGNGAMKCVMSLQLYTNVLGTTTRLVYECTVALFLMGRMYGPPDGLLRGSEP